MNPRVPSIDCSADAVAASGKTLAEHAGLSRNTIKVLYATAVGHFEASRFSEAAAVLFQLVALDPKSEDAWALYGNVLMRLGRFQAAVTSWEMAMACTPRFSTAALIARTAIAIGSLDRAAEALLMARRYKKSPVQEREFDELVEAWYGAQAATVR